MRSLRPFFRPAAPLVAALLLTACGGGSHGSLPAPAGGGSGALANAKFAFTIPVASAAPTASAASAIAASGRKPLYIPATTLSLQLTVTASTNASFSGPLSRTLNVAQGTSGTGFSCTAVVSANYTCTTTFPLPPGTDTLSIASFDAINAGGNLLSRQIVTKTVVAGANDFTGTPIILDAVPGALSVIALSGPTGTYPSFSVVGTSAVTFTVSVVDAHGTAFGGQPGLPTITHAAATGTGASAVVSGSTLTLTPPSSGSSTSVVVDADPLGAQDVTTTLASSPAAGATSFTVASASGIVAGENLVLDYESFSGTTLLQESALVTNVSGTTITVSAGLAHAHLSGAGVRHYSDNLTPSTALFTVAITQPVAIVPVATLGFEAAPSKALVYNPSFALQTGTLAGPSVQYSYGRFDSTGKLYILDENADAVYRSQYTAGSGFGAVTPYTGIPGQGGIVGFDVSSNGTVAVENGAGISPQLDYYAPGTNATPGTFTSGLSTATWNTATFYTFPSVAVLTDGSGTVFGYAYDVFNVSGSAHDQIVVTSGTSEQDINIASIVSTSFHDTGVPVLTWDQGRQSLIYGNSEASGSFSILEFPRNGTTGALLQTSPATVGTVTGFPQAVAVSRDGAYVAVAWNTGSATNMSIFHNNGSAWALASAGSALTTANFANFTSVHFLPNGNLIVSDSDGSYANLSQYTNAGALVGSVYNATPNFGSGYLINDVAVSY